MEKLLTSEDLACINEALARGVDVRVQMTKGGYRILEDKVKVLKSRGTGKEQSHEGTD